MQRADIVKKIQTVMCGVFIVCPDKATFDAMPEVFVIDDLPCIKALFVEDKQQAIYAAEPVHRVAVNPKYAKQEGVKQEEAAEGFPAGTVLN